MNQNYLARWSRRRFLGHVTAAGTAGMAGIIPGIAAADPPPETTSIRIVYDPTFPVLCYGPQYVATELLKMEGFTDIEYAPYAEEDTNLDSRVVSGGRADISTVWVADTIMNADEGGPVVALSGMHIGCTEIVAQKDIHSIKELKGRKIALITPGSPEQAWLSILFNYIGLDPLNDVEWVIMPYEAWGESFEAGEVDALVLWPPDAQIYRNQKIGNVILDTSTDKPWSDYYCCIISGNQDFVAKHPVATKRAMRAMLKATDMCALNPEGAAQRVIDNEFPTDYETALQVFSEIPYALWRDLDPEDTFRFYAVRMHQLGLIKQTPETLIANHTDWRFLEELKQTLKA